MTDRFEFDAEREVTDELYRDTGCYINDRVQEIVETRYSLIIDETAKLLYPEEYLLEKFKRLAYGVGAAVTLESLEHSDLDRYKIDYIKHSFLCTLLPRNLRDSDPEELKDQIKFTSLIGHASHPELDNISNRISNFYVGVTQNIELRSAVFLGVGRTAFVLDTCFDKFRVIDPRFDFERSINETDFQNIDWHRLLDE